MIECLKEQKKQLSQRCHQRIFRLQEVEMTDPELDYQLMRVCKQMIKVVNTHRRSQADFLLHFESVVVMNRRDSLSGLVVDSPAAVLY